MIGTRSWLHRTLGKLEAYSPESSVPQDSSPQPLGTLKNDAGQPVLVIYDDGVTVSSTGAFINFRDIKNVKLVGEDKREISELIISTAEQDASISVGTMTSGYRDVFVVCRFLMRTAEDNGAQLYGLEH